MVRPRSGSLSSLGLRVLLVLSVVFWPTRSPSYRVKVDWPVGDASANRGKSDITLQHL